MKNQKETFASMMQSFDYRYDQRSAFDDFLTMSICACSQNPFTRKSHDEDLYLQTIAKYKKDDIRFQFPKLFAVLTLEMEERLNSESGNDVLGEYYEQNLYKKGTSQYFTPWHICSFMARGVVDKHYEIDKDRPLRILDPSCGSGRMLLASKEASGIQHEFYGIDIDHTCVKMTAINFFMNGMFHSEVLCANALVPEDFRVSYQISFLPFGIFKIEMKERSKLWHMLKNSFDKKEKVETESLQLPSEKEKKNENDSSQMILF